MKRCGRANVVARLSGVGKGYILFVLTDPLSEGVGGKPGADF